MRKTSIFDFEFRLVKVKGKILNALYEKKKKKIENQLNFQYLKHY